MRIPHPVQSTAALLAVTGAARGLVVPLAPPQSVARAAAPSMGWPQDTFADDPPPGERSTTVLAKCSPSATLASLASSRRALLRGAALAAGMYYGGGTVRASAYTVERVKPDERDTYAVAQEGDGPLRVLWVGAGEMKGVFNNLFQAGNEVVAVDIRRPDTKDLRAATAYATEHGYQLRFERGDATRLKFADATFDVVVCSQFLCQDFDPAVVVTEIRRVLKDGGRFGFFEDVEDIDNVIVGKVFGERSVVRVQALPERLNIMAGVVRKV